MIPRNNALLVSWNAAPDEAGKPPVSGYEVTHRRGDAGDWREGLLLNGRGDTSVTITRLNNERIHQARVRSFNDEGKGPWSEPVAGVPTAGPKVARGIPDQSLYTGGGNGRVNLAVGFTRPGGRPLLYGAASSDSTIAAVSVSDSMATLRPLAGGRVTVTATASDLWGNGAQTTFNVVVTSGPPPPPRRPPPPRPPPPPPPDTSPDLLVGSPSVSDSSLDTRGSFTLSATVRNGGSGSSVATTLRYYRSSDATISGTDTEVGTDAVSVIAASGTSDQSISLTAPSDAGTYYYGACVDAVTGESNSGNNCSGAVQVTVSGGSPPSTPQVTISAGTTPVTEGTAATFTVSASPAPTTALTVTVKVSETEDVLSGTPPSTVTINANAATATLTVSTDNDQADESNSVVTAQLQAGTGYTVGATSSASVTVEDNDPPQVTISAGTTPVTEGTDVTFTITASPAPTSALTVNVDVDVTYADHLTSGTPPSTVTINANATTATLTVATDDDDVIEINGQVIAEVQTGTGYTVGSSSSARVVIENNDHPTPVASVEIDPGSVEFTEVGATETLTARILDSEGNETRPTSWGWSSADEEVATVDHLIGTGVRGWVKAIGAGTTTITLVASGREEGRPGQPR